MSGAHLINNNPKSSRPWVSKRAHEALQVLRRGGCFICDKYPNGYPLSEVQVRLLDGGGDRVKGYGRAALAELYESGHELILQCVAIGWKVVMRPIQTSNNGNRSLSEVIGDAQ